MENTQPVIPGNSEIEKDETGQVSLSKEMLALAKAAFDEGETFQEKELKKRWNDNYRFARSEHQEGSKYLSEAYKRKSRFFRGKTESSIRKNMAACAVALFSNKDVVSIEAENKDVENAKEITGAIHQLVNYRLEDSIKWFETVLGAYHEAMTPGIVTSEQYWEYEKNADDEVIDDRPAIDIYPPENVKISPNADWRDPINSSPYVIIQIPMFVGDIKERMEFDWEKHTDAEIASSLPSAENKDTKEARTGRSEEEKTSAVTDFTLGWVNKNFIRKDGKEYFFYTLGTRFLLSDPEPLAVAYPHCVDGKRPLQTGTATIEPHSVYKRGLVDRVKEAQKLSNEIANQRIDNVKLVMNRRYFSQRGMNTDFRTLTRNVAGSVILTDDVNSVQPEKVLDVTGSSYQEQHMLNADFDELAGSFSNASVSTNRALNDTVGGMQMLQGNSNILTEFQLRIFVETWVEPVIRQLVKMVKFYESDETIQAVTGKPFTNADFQIPVKTRVSVGFGATDPNAKVQKLALGLQTLFGFFPNLAQEADSREISKELFGALGFNDGAKFLPEREEDPEVSALKQQIQQIMQAIESKSIEHAQNKEIEEIRGKYRVQAALEPKAIDRTTKLTELSLASNREQRREDHEDRKINLEYMKELIRQLEASTQKQELDAKVSGQIDQGI